MSYLEERIKKRIIRKKEQLNKLRPLPSSAVKKLREQFKIEMTYNSNAIEGNTLTLKETFLVINEGITVKGKPLKDHLETKNHYEALEYLLDLIENKKNYTISEQLIRNLHQIVMKETDEQWAGKYRNSGVAIVGSDHKPPNALNIPDLMHKLIIWWKDKQNKLHPAELAALLHYKIVNIHPFFDGNGRTARLIMNLVLVQASYPLVTILKNDRKKYYRVLSQADKNDLTPLIRFVAQAVERSLDIYLKTLTPTSKRKEKFIPLSEAAKDCPYSAKYLNLLARQGKLEVHKENRNWLTTKKAIERYIKNRKRQKKIND